jgi:tetratricopeptide (TPR) repeat protein
MEAPVNTAFRRGLAVPIALAAVCSTLLLPLPAMGEEDLASAHVTAAVQKLFAADQQRVDAASRALTEQDIIRQEVAVCIDPASGRLEGRARIWVESTRDHIQLVLDESLRVLTARDSRGDTLTYLQTAGILVVHADEDAAKFPLEIELTYEGTLTQGAGARVSEDAVVLGHDFHWYPVSDARDPARLRIEARYPAGYSSVVSGMLAGMAPSLEGENECSEGDVWDVPTPVTGAAIVVGRLEGSLTVVGDVFLGYHGHAYPDVDPAEAARRVSPPSVPQEFIELLRFLETCFGPYPYEWLNIVRLPAGVRRPRAVMAGPGLVVFWDGDGQSGRPSVPLGRVAAGLADSWWTFWMDPGRLVSASLASQVEAEWMEAIGDEDGAARLRGLRRSQFTEAVRDSGRGISLLECFERELPSDSRICEGKGPAVFEILKSVVGPREYCAALQAVASASGGEPVGLRELADAFESESGGDLDWFFYEWMCRSDLPSYAIEYESVPAGDGTYLVRGVIGQEGEPFRTPLPLTVDLGGWAYDEVVEVESSQQLFEIRTDAEPMEITVDERQLIPRMDRDELAAMHFERGSAAVASGLWDAAVDELGAAAALAPDSAVYLHAYAGALVRHGRLSDGLDTMDRAVGLDPGDAGLRLEAAGLHLRSGDPAGALDHLDSYLRAMPDDPVAHSERARALAELGRLDEAELSVDRARELTVGEDTDPDLMEAILLATGRISELRGDRAAAARAYEAALAANPVSDEARRRIRALNTSEEE